MHCPVAYWHTSFCANESFFRTVLLMIIEHPITTTHDFSGFLRDMDGSGHRTDWSCTNHHISMRPWWSYAVRIHSRGLYTPVYELRTAVSLPNAVAYSCQPKHSRVTTSHVRVTRPVVWNLICTAVLLRCPKDHLLRRHMYANVSAICSKAYCSDGARHIRADSFTMSSEAPVL